MTLLFDTSIVLATYLNRCRCREIANNVVFVAQVVPNPKLPNRRNKAASVAQANLHSFADSFFEKFEKSVFACWLLSYLNCHFSLRITILLWK